MVLGGSLHWIFQGLSMENCVHSVSVAFSPVVTIALHCGIRCSRAGTSVGCTTSRNLSEALSCRRRMAEAVSNKAIPFSCRKLMRRSLQKAFFVLSTK